METLSIPIDQLLKEAPNSTINELAERYSTDYGTVYRILARYRVEAAKAYEPLTKEVLEAVFEEPTTVVEAAEQLHVTPATVTHAIKKFGLFGGTRKPTVKSTFNGTRAFKVLGYILNHPEENLASIGRRFNCTREYVRQIKECGIAEGIIKSWANASDKLYDEAQQEGIEL
jgi:predicted transcriptional regulator